MYLSIIHRKFMSKLRNIEEVIRADRAHWVGNGFRVKQYFPAAKGRDFLDRFSPFILMDYNEPHEFKASNSLVGVDVHPHRGFETVTIALDGYVEHGDNKGHSGIIGPGDVQWMTAGSGVLHKEFHEKEYAKQDRVFHMIQLWVNLPAKYKMTDPKYQALTKDMMGIYENEDKSVRLSVIAGKALGVEGPATTFSAMNIYRGELERNAGVVLEENKDFNTGMLITSGEVYINNSKFLAGEFILFSNEEGAIEVRTEDEKASFVVLSGQPLNEPIVAHGPFVMNTYEEILQANKDYQEGKFGSFDF